ncbi:Acetolactate synthase isozyme 2 large subunit [Candidatus Annandia adelgestsuga]|uniref:Acetolactate synthase n=1 Tax=Candidatus Annandia adelgestsuga TaxID=1302411 RepID=A0A3S9J7H6_9ENTR|nr:acetolactate synthase 2 catalytic subunit [Candidatus Annandia adelgestsuga]AZP36192.1 Acetolactate synthase isozyme 2 large subunit [Candidatus Annandia adelgestsuga]
MIGAQYLIYILSKLGVEIIFGYPGGAIMPIYNAIYKSNIKHILCRHEQGAIMSAIGYSRSTNKIGVCIVTSGPGATNIITGLADAFMDSVPIIAITGQVSSDLIGSDAFQEVDMMGLSMSCTKYSFLINSIYKIKKIIYKSFEMAVTNRPGPILIDIPKDIQLKKIEIKKINIKKKYNYKKKFFYCKKNLDKIISLIKKSKKPIIYAGGGIGISKSINSFKNFIKNMKIPMVVTLKGIGIINSNNYKYHLGMIGMHGNQEANLAVQECDLLIAIGSRFDDRVTGNLNNFANLANIIHLDIDSSEINKICKVNLYLCGNLNYILPILKCKINIKKWQKKILLLKKRYSYNYKHNYKKIWAPYLLKILSDNKNKNTIITTDVGQHQMWVAQHINFNNNKNFITSSGLGSMGFGIPSAIGAQIAEPKKNVICITGDGSFIMNIQELCTIKRYNLPIKILLLDNKRLGMVRQWQELFFFSRYSETNLDDNPNFIKIANSFNIKGKRITKKKEIKYSIKKFLNTKESYLLHVSIDKYDNVWPLVPPGVSNTKMIEY